MAELTEFVDAETAEAVAVAAGAPIDQDAPTPRKYKRRGRVTKWLAIGWLFFIIFSAVGANWLPYVKHSCSQYSNPLMCSTHVKGTPLKIERPPVWAFWAHPARSLPGSPERGGVDGHRPQRLRHLQPGRVRRPRLARDRRPRDHLRTAHRRPAGPDLRLPEGDGRPRHRERHEHHAGLPRAPARHLRRELLQHAQLDRSGDLAPDLADHPRALLALHTAPHPARPGQHDRLRGSGSSCSPPAASGPRAAG